jgi:hypothetical protein
MWLCTDEEKESLSMNKKLILRTLLFSLVLFFVLYRSSEAALCAFRNPDRDVYFLFPEATAYRSVTKVINSKIQKKTEEFLGLPLDYDEDGEHTFYLILKGEDVIGIIRPHAERGKYGIVEMVWAFTLDGKIIDFIIQRSRERGTMKLKSEGFRRQFKGKNLNDPFTIPGTKELNTDFIKPVKGTFIASSIVAYSGKKNLLLYKYFFPEYSRKSEKLEGEKVENGRGQ